MEPTPPFTEPNRVDTQDREVTARWLMGNTDEHDWQPELVLTVRHHAKHGYRSTLFNAQTRHTPAVHDELFDPLARTVIHDEPTTARYSDTRLHDVYTAAVAALRRCLVGGAKNVIGHLPVTIYDGVVVSYSNTPVRLRVRAVAPVTVADLAQGQLFSVDNGLTWHACASPWASTAALEIYGSDRRDVEAPTAVLDNAPDDICWLVIP